MTDKQQTAVQWLKEQLPSLFIDDSGHYKKLFDQALVMEQKQREDAQVEGMKIAFQTASEKLERELKQWKKLSGD